MDLILWRHAEAFDLAEGGTDLERMLTPRGEKQAARMAAWLDRQLPEGVRVLCSPARRTEQTAQALGRKYKLRSELAPEGHVDDLLAVVGWPQTRAPILVVGHQPLLQPGQSFQYTSGRPCLACWVCRIRSARYARGPSGGCAVANAKACCRPSS